MGGVHDPVAPADQFVAVGEVVDVVAAVDDEVEVVARREVAVAAPPAAPVAGAREHREAQVVHRAGRGGARAPDDALHAECLESVVVRRRGFEADGVDLDGPVVLRGRRLGAARDDVAHPRVATHRPAHRDRRRTGLGDGHARPEDHAIGERIARRHAVGEGQVETEREVDRLRERDATRGLAATGGRDRGEAEAERFQEAATIERRSHGEWHYLRPPRPVKHLWSRTAPAVSAGWLSGRPCPMLTMRSSRAAS